MTEFVKEMLNNHKDTKGCKMTKRCEITTKRHKMTTSRCKNITTQCKITPKRCKMTKNLPTNDTPNDLLFVVVLCLSVKIHSNEVDMLWKLYNVFIFKQYL